MKSPEWIRDLLGIVKEFGLALLTCGLGVTAVTLVFVGLATLLQWSVQDLLRYYTPLLLGLFSITITLYLFYRNIREGRDRAKQERDHAVRPVLTMNAVDVLKSAKNKVDFELAYPIPTADGEEIIHGHKWLEIENIGVGPALDVGIIAFVNFQYCKLGGSIDVLKPDNKVFIKIELSIPEDSIEDFYTVYTDVYGNFHVCAHMATEDDVDDSERIMTHYVREGDEFKKPLVDLWANLNPCSFKYVERGIAESVSVLGLYSFMK